MREKTPSREECLRMLRENYVPPHIIAHSEAVADVALELGREMKKNGERVNLRLLDAGALLHDISKFASLGKHETEISHGETGAKLLRKLGFPWIAEIAQAHMFSSIFTEGALDTWEKKLVYYADKRVNHDRRVKLDSRIAYLSRRYPKGARMFREARPLLKELEKELFSKARMKI